MKNIKYLSVTVFCFFIQCSRNCDIKDFQLKYIGYSNFTISHKEIFPNEKLVIIINDKMIGIVMGSISDCASCGSSLITLPIAANREA